MTGKTHKFIGLAAGAAIVYAGMGEESLFYLLACPVGAMIPDIDHDNSKLGRFRKNILAAVSTIFGAFALVAIVFFLIEAYESGNLTRAIATLALLAVPFALLVSLSRIKAVRKNLKFMAKHRGLMHTLILPAGMFGAGFLVTEPTFAALLTGVNIGYITHIIADMLTAHGCPVFYPLSKKNVNVMNIRTGSPREYIAGAVLAAAVAAVFLTGLINL